MALTLRNVVINETKEVKMPNAKYELNKKTQLSFDTKISAIDEEERSITAVISTSAVDRDREVLVPKGIQTERFEENPVVLWAHDSGSPPIGKALWVKVKGQKILAKVQFATTEFAEEIWQLFKGGFLKAFSVGFIPHEGHSPTPKEIVKNPEWAEARFVIDKWELLEFSPVPIPSNPQALAQAIKSKSITLSDSTKDLFSASLQDDDFEKHIDCTIKGTEDEINEELDIEVKAIPEIRVTPDVEVKAVPVDVEVIASETIKKLKGVMY